MVFVNTLSTILHEASKTISYIAAAVCGRNHPQPHPQQQQQPNHTNDGKHGVQWSKLSKESRKQAVLKQLSHFFGEEAKHPIDYAEKLWHEEPYCGGCPIDIPTTGVMKYFASGLREPFKNLHWAGTESATVWCGFVNGAVQAGLRAATEVLYKLDPSAVSKEDLEGTAYGSRKRAVPIQSNNRHIKKIVSFLALGAAVSAVAAFLLRRKF